jgi:hypothetical protein
MAKFMILIFGDEAQWSAMTPEQETALGAGHNAFRAEAGARILADGELDFTSTAMTVRSDGAGGLTTTDGPFLETKEALGGFYLLDAASLDEAVQLASQLPEVQASHSGVEIRPLVDHG